LVLKRAAEGRHETIRGRARGDEEMAICEEVKVVANHKAEVLEKQVTRSCLERVHLRVVWSERRVGREKEESVLG
jgi:hypothetical protein